MRTQANNRSRGVCYVILSLLLVTVCAAGTICAQEPSTKQTAPREIPLDALHKAPGELVAQGINALPIGPLGVKTYRLEEVKLDEPIELTLRGHKKRIESAFRLTITGESFGIGSVTIWIDDEPVSDPLSGRTELPTIIFDRDLLQEGASISVSLDLGDNRYSRTTLPERLELPERWRAALRSANDHKPTVRMHRIASSPALQNEPGIEMLLTGDAMYPVQNAMLIVSIGDQEFGCSPRFNGDPYTLVCHISEEQFEKLKDGDMIRAKYGRGLTLPSYQRFGRLKKSLPDR
jgi:hypothetical protein